MSALNQPLVSILVPVYGVEQYIERCATSLFEQTYSNIEFVFADDCTPDASISILEHTLSCYPQRQAQSKILHHQQNRGLSAARNTALDNSAGDYLMIVDSDDWLVDNTVVSTLVERAEKTHADIVVFDFLNIYAHSQSPSYKNIPTNKESYLKYLLECRCTPSLATSFYKAALFRDNNVRNIEGVDMSEDYTVQPRLVYYANTIDYLRKPLYCYYRANEHSYINSIKPSTSSAIPEVDVIEQFFNDKPDRGKYQPSIEAARLLKSARRFVNWAKYSGDLVSYKSIPKFTTPSYLFNSRLMFKYKIVILLQRLHLQRLFAAFVRRQWSAVNGQ